MIILENNYNISTKKASMTENKASNRMPTLRYTH